MSITIKILGDDRQFKAALKGAKSDSESFAQKMEKVGKRLGLAMVAVGAAVAVAVGTVAIKGIVSFAKFEQQMNEVFTLLPNISGQAMDELTGQVKDFAKEFGTLPDEVVPALYQAISAGVPKDNVFDFLEVAQKAAIGGVTELETAVDGISSVVNAYGSDVIDAAKASDLMFTAVRLGKTDFNQLSKSLFNVLPTAAAVGVTFGEVTAAIANMTAMGTPTAVATTQMRAMLVELSKDGTEVNKTFQKITGQGFQEFIEGGGDLVSAIAVIDQAAQDNGVALQDMFGSVEAGAAALALGGENADAYMATLAEMDESAGASQAAFEQMDQGLGRTWDKIKATVGVALLNIGEKMAPLAEKFGAFFEDKLPGFIEGAEKLFENIAAFITDRVIPAFAQIQQWWDQNGPTIIAALSLVADMVRDLVEKALAKLSTWWETNGPIVISIVEGMRDAIVDAFDAIVDAVHWVITNWEELEGPMKITAGFILAVLIPHWVALGIAATISAVKQVVAWVVMKAAAISSVFAASIAMVTFIAKWAWVGTKALFHAARVAAAWLIAMGPIGWVIAAIAGAVTLIVIHWDTIKNAALAVKDWIVDKFTALIDFFKGLPAKIRSATSGMWNGIKDAFKAAINWIIRKWNALEISIGGGKILGVSIPKITVRTPNIPLFDHGGIFRAPTAGGHGLAILRDRERVIPAGGGGGGGDTFIIQGFVGSPEQAAAAMDRMLTKRSRTSGLGFV